MKLRIGEIYRFEKDNKRDNEQFIDGIKNYVYYTQIKDSNFGFRFERGIHKVKQVKTTTLDRTPLIIVSSSPHKAGTDATPWKDRYDSDNGIVDYYGDCKSNLSNPYETPGNKTLMTEWRKHSSSDKNVRLHATPILFFERIKKGYLLFHGVGVIEKVNLVTQQSNGNEFTNLEFEFCILDLSKENNELDWEWIKNRCNYSLDDFTSNKNAPDSWKYWINYGNSKLENVRRHVLKSRIIKEKNQRPPKGSIEEKILKIIEEHYSSKKILFEQFALRVTHFYFLDNDLHLLNGYVTKGSGDKGIDFVSRFDIGNDLASVRMVVIGQAKCQKNTISSIDIARTVSKLKRNFLGVFVTNSVFSIQTQEEIFEDQYPLIMINGYTMAQLTNKYILGSSNNLDILKEYLNQIDQEYNDSKSNMRPDDIIYK